MLIYFIGILAFSAKNGTLVSDLYHTKFLLKLIVSGSGASYILIYQNLDKIKLFLNKKKEESMDTDKYKEELKIEDKELMDYKTLAYLRSRAKELKSQEMMDLIVKINNMLFSLSVDKPWIIIISF